MNRVQVSLCYTMCSMCGTSLVLVLLCHTNIGVVDMTKELIVILLKCACVYVYECVCEQCRQKSIVI